MTLARISLPGLLLLPLTALASEPTDSAGQHAACGASPTPHSAWADTSLDQWEIREFAGASTYELTELDGTRVLQASTNGAAAVLYRQQTIDISTTPIVRWSWKVDSVYDNASEQEKSGDDFPARVYVVVSTGLLPWETHAINYVFTSSADVGSEWLNPFTDKAMMVAVRSGAESTGQWFCEERNVAEDLARAFPEQFPEPPEELSGYAVMIDGDNGGYSGNSYFGGISFHADE